MPSKEKLTVIEGASRRLTLAKKNNPCKHLRELLIDDTLNTVECADCGKEVNPIYVLKLMLRKQSHLEHLKHLNDEHVKKYQEKRRTKCKHCGKMTEVNW